MSKFHPTYEDLLKGWIDVFISRSTIESKKAVELHHHTMRRILSEFKEKDE